MKTKMMTKVILTVFTLAFGMSPREEARRDSGSSASSLLAAAAVAVELAIAFPFLQMVRTMMM